MGDEPQVSVTGVTGKMPSESYKVNDKLYIKMSQRSIKENDKDVNLFILGQCYLS